MAKKATAHAHPPELQELGPESLYVGIDIGKHRHVAGFLSSTLLARHHRFEGCPALAFEQSREGFAPSSSASKAMCRWSKRMSCWSQPGIIIAR